ncbi:hypothetical protein PF005_g29159 [Phytophthora fragariae]|uniref:Uncharacterized protein n=1 Tax=Phytophthora fragariae TaxID=53985 RepID=A0A6A3VFI3_9STRA|nr:hypothetical protein PF005_g29159 [Phytophthora fragariae]
MLLFCMHQPNVTSCSRRVSRRQLQYAWHAMGYLLMRQQYRVTTTTGLENGDDGIEQAGDGTSPASSSGSGSSTASPPPGSSMGTTASSKLGTAQAQPS